MSKSIRLVSAAVAALTTAALAAGPASAHPQRSAVFVQNDDPAGNTIVAYDRNDDGSLTQAGSYRTGGLGGVLDGSVVDHLASQGSLQLDRGLLYAVNAGSNTITVFAVDGDRLIRRQVLPSFGEFPVSIATHGNTVYVLNARRGGSIQGFARVGGILVPLPLSHRALGLDLHGAPEFTATPGQVTFTPDGRRLLVTTKSSTSSVLTFDVNPLGIVSARPEATVVDGAGPFAAAFDARGNAVVAEIAAGAVASFSLDRRGALHQLASTPTGQAATCWIVNVNGRFYVSNAGSGTISIFDQALRPLGRTATHPGTVDSAPSPDGRFLYVQTGGDGGVDAFRVNPDGSLTPAGSVTVPGAAGGEGIAVS
jgi:6-phosphogluconolactonase (cycloisomerase 2 family)